MCECYQIGGPFIAGDPDCPVHGTGGYEERIQQLQQQNESLKQELINVAHETGMEIAEMKGDKRVLEQQNQEMLEMLKRFGSILCGYWLMLTKKLYAHSSQRLNATAKRRGSDVRN